METKYGYIDIITEDGRKKIDWVNCKFNYPELTNFFKFCHDDVLIKNIIGY